MKKLTVLIVLSLCANLMAAVIKPDLGVPLKDAAVCRGPSGEYYLTGTTAIEGKKGKPDFHNNYGARVWSSTDLKSWTDLGWVWDFRSDSDNQKHKGGDAFATELYPVPGLPPGDRGRAMTAPSLLFHDNRFFLTFSVNGYAARLLVTEKADIDGPWINLKKMVEVGGSHTGQSDASIYVDKDKTPYLVWGGGCIAKLKDLDELNKMNGNNQLGFFSDGVENPRHYLPTLIEGYPGDDGLPEHGAPYGASVFLDDDCYVFLFSATTLRDGNIHEDSYLCRADRLLGAYSKPKPFILDSGRCAVFTTPEGKRMVSYSDPAGQPVIVDYPTALPPVAETGAPKARLGKIATKISLPGVSEKPKDVNQLVEMIEPLFDTPLRDPSMCQDPDGTWYLTGTEASWKAEGRRQKAEGPSKAELDWANNKGVRLWKSQDLDNWEDLGYVWDCDKDGQGWHNQSHLDLTCGAEPKIGRAVTAPEMHYLKGTFWIVYSMNGSGIGILKSKTGEAEGPYEDLGQLVKNGRDGSLLVDGGDVYLVWGQGFRAKLSDDMTRLAGPVETMFTNVKWNSRYLRRHDVIGQWGSNLTKAGDKYIWTFTTRSGRGGINAIDTLASWSTSIDGPWCEPCLMLPNSGQSAVATANDGQTHYATVSGEDEHSQCPYLPAITKIHSYHGWSQKALANSAKPISEVKPQGGGHQDNFYGIQGEKATELDYWIGHPELLDEMIRDVCLDRFEDGYYYVSGSFWDVKRWANQVPVYRSKDKIHWEPVPGSVMDIETLRKSPFFDAESYDKFAAEKAKRGGFPVNLFEIKLYEYEGNAYVSVAVCRGPAYLLKAKSMSDPFEVIARIGFGEYFRDNHGTFYFNTPGRISRIDGFADFEKGGRGEGLPIQAPDNLCFLEDAETGLQHIDGKYVVWSTDWNGNYDMNYMVGDTVEGPWSKPRIGVPHGGNGFMFEDEHGSWWYAYFNNVNDFGTRHAAFQVLNMMPLYVDVNGDEPIIEPKAVRKNRARLEKLGAMWQSPEIRSLEIR